MPDPVKPDVILTRDQIPEATKLFVEGIKHGFADDHEGKVCLSKAVDVLRTAFEMMAERNNLAARAIPVDKLNASHDELYVVSCLHSLRIPG
jgi:hypothetical protein